VQATASTKDLDRADVAVRGSPETGYETYRQSDCYAVGELDPQCTFTGAVLHIDSPRLGFRCMSPGAGRPSEVRTELLLYPPEHQP